MGLNDYVVWQTLTQRGVTMMDERTLLFGRDRIPRIGMRWSASELPS